LPAYFAGKVRGSIKTDRCDYATAVTGKATIINFFCAVNAAELI
jgi:hypothetical protein